MVKFLVRFKDFVDKYKLCYSLFLVAASFAIVFIPFVSVLSSPRSYFTMIKVSVNSLSANYTDDYRVNMTAKLIRNIIFYSIAIFFTLVIAVSSLILSAKKKVLLPVSFMSLILLLAVFIYLRVSLNPALSPKIYSPHAAFYILLILTLFEILYYTAWIVSIRSQKTKEPKPVKPQNLSAKERIEQLEREVAELKAGNKKGDD